MQNNKVLKIAEIGINHNGSLSIAKRLIDGAAKAKFECVKFQLRDLNKIYSKKFIKSPENIESGSQYIYGQLKKTHLSNSNYLKLFNYSKKKKLKIAVTPFDLNSLEFLKKHLNKIDFIKIGSPDFDNLFLISEAIKFKKKIILSTGMNNQKEIEEVVKFLKIKKANFNLLHCCSSYPASNDEINLKFIKTLRSISGRTVGYSGHEKGIGPTLFSLYFGGRIIERHITISKDLEGPDHTSSLNLYEMKNLSNQIKKIENNNYYKNKSLKFFINKFNLYKDYICLGRNIKIVNQNVKMNKIILGKSLIYKKNLKKNYIVKLNDLDLRSPAKGNSLISIKKYLKKKLQKNVIKNDYVKVDDFLYKNKNNFEKFNINKKWGIVARLGDVRDFIDNKADLIELHLTWKELINYSTDIPKINKNLVVHAPEYYYDKLIDFTTDDKDVLDYSHEMINKVVSFTNDIASKFKIDDPRGPRIVLHPGGHFQNPKNIINKKNKYKNLLKNLKKIKLFNSRLLVENMPPFPWYYGGRYYNYIFTDPVEIKKFAEESSFKICYDTSHAQLYCNYNKINLSHFTKLVKKHTEYLHISDAFGNDGEGMQIGEGNVNFEKFFRDMSDMDLGFIPEIWQGHLNNGKGFEIALNNIKKILRKVSVKKCSNH